MKEISLDAVIENIDTVTDFVNEQLETAGCPMKVQIQIDIAVDEILSNISRYAYAPNTGKVWVGVEIKQNPTAAVISFKDEGYPYNPLAKEDPNVTLSAEERKIGGLGIFIVKKSMDGMEYENIDGKNILILTKNF